MNECCSDSLRLRPSAEMTTRLVSSIKPIDQLDEMEIDPSAVLPVERRIRIMLKVIADSERAGHAAGNSECPYKLKWPAKILPAELIIAKQGPSPSDVDRDQSILAPEDNIKRHDCHDPISFVGSA